ncbi:MAG: hypothetical protein AAF936_09010 [Pseudomonadota bacterium]
MKLFAVFLASIAALAATVQAYLIWDFASRGGDDKRLKYKLEACSSAIQSLTAIQRLTKDPAGEVARMLEAQGRIRIVSSGDDSEESGDIRRADITEEMQRENAERMVLFSFSTPALQLQGFADAQIYYFSESEQSKIDLAGIISAVDQGSHYQIYTGNDNIPFEERISRYRQAVGQLPAIKAICLPLMSGG